MSSIGTLQYDKEHQSLNYRLARTTHETCMHCFHRSFDPMPEEPQGKMYACAKMVSLGSNQSVEDNHTCDLFYHAY